MNDRTRKASAAAGSALLIAAGALAASPLSAHAATQAPEAPAATVEQSCETAAVPAASAQQVSGDFAFSQDALTPTAELSGVFAKAASTLCVALPQYCSTCGGLLTVASANGSAMGTVADLAGQDSPAGAVMACACASNVAGGGAVANADASGAALATLAALVGAL